MSRPLRRFAAVVTLVLTAGALAPLGITSAGAAADDQLFRPAPSVRLDGAKVRVSPEHYSAVTVDLAGLRTTLGAAPRGRTAAPLVLRVPTPAGGTERFAVRRTQVMQPALAAAHPELATYAGRSLDHAGTTIALDLTPMGFHAQVRGPQGQGSWYVDPAYDRRGTTTHLAYYASSVERGPQDFVERESRQVSRAVTQRAAQQAAGRTTASRTRPGGLVKQRTYRLALTSDPTYAAYFGSENVLAEKVTLINRVNQVYNDDTAIRLQLVDGEDQLNFDTDAKATGPNGPCGENACFTAKQLAACDIGTLGRNRTVLGELIGAGNYDIGHIVLGVNGGGVAWLGVVGADYKAGGCTGLPQPQGDFMALDYVAHEMGHQFDGNHTFNGVQYACGGPNRAGGASVEPGSGSSIMAYAGICLQDDLQPHTDPYFSQRTIAEVSSYTTRALRPVAEVQNVSLAGFDTDGETISLAYGTGGGTPVTLTRGVDYDAAHLEAAIEAQTGRDVTVVGWGYDPMGSYRSYPAKKTLPNDTGFQVIFSPKLLPRGAPADSVDMAPLQVTSTSPGVSTHVAETARGGPAGNAGNTVVETANHAPVVSAPANRTIPRQTPFRLTGRGIDPDGDALTYLWEQNDIGRAGQGTKLVSNTKVWGPLFRVFGTYADVSDEATQQTPSPGENTATGSPTRVFPDLKQVLANNTNAKDGTCPRVAPPGDVSTYTPVKRRIVNCFSEFLPTGDYRGRRGTSAKHPAMHFRLTARDGFADGGGTAHDDVRLRISRTAGPFLVTSQRAKGTSVRAGKPMSVTWKVNGTRPLAARVRILLSTDGGSTWSTVLTPGTANDGSARVQLPRDATSRARIMVEAVDNYFFDVNDRDFRIRARGGSRG
ncbi:hypothetical protein H5V45_14600 [Nocardioides sp. KIGAM211]|uniref:Reprolysin-like metallo-peptidase family M12B n=1 Tax=Nocardioides luti TaxID=2761101 RepID=A0A7X0RHV2_9ACTN|nr:M12 family metallo-peptidase [Nocardioides luti]MBB6628552.1 hypothetical protein [Nocardioides luti]